MRVTAIGGEGAGRIGLRSIRPPGARPMTEAEGAAAGRFAHIMPARHRSGNRARDAERQLGN
ncbi:hypothetical protein ACV229_01900 [Burkholderia sp. MR1-5-21]